MGCHGLPPRGTQHARPFPPSTTRLSTHTHCDLRPPPPAAEARLAVLSELVMGSQAGAPRGVPEEPVGRSGGSMSRARCMLSHPTENMRWQAATRWMSCRSVPVHVRECRTCIG